MVYVGGARFRLKNSVQNVFNGTLYYNHGWAPFKDLREKPYHTSYSNMAVISLPHYCGGASKTQYMTFSKSIFCIFSLYSEANPLFWCEIQHSIFWVKVIHICTIPITLSAIEDSSFSADRFMVHSPLQYIRYITVFYHCKLCLNYWLFFDSRHKYCAGSIF